MASYHDVFVSVSMDLRCVTMRCVRLSAKTASPRVRSSQNLLKITVVLSRARGVCSTLQVWFSFENQQFDVAWGTMT